MSSIRQSHSCQVPDFQEAVFAPRAYDYALVIPVINEGTRIQSQLKRINDLRPARVDVVIADGGSTDGSLALPFLRSCNVRALLTKTGSGKLSAQLRMAYAWCLDQGYAGVVTMDGNGKDNVDAIPAFVQHLQEGYDLVQGSRYRPGGRAVNTPLDRHLAGRFIHAPLISVAAGHWYTDTTNGFRAYSARLLQDPRLAIFRSLFDRYQLLFYLSVRAPRLGYRVCEIPVERHYPAKGSTPTKIAGWRGRLEMMSELMHAALGRYNP